MDEIKVKPDPDGDTSPVSLPTEKEFVFIKQEKDTSDMVDESKEDLDTVPTIKQEIEDEDAEDTSSVNVHSGEQLSNQEYIIPHSENNIDVCDSIQTNISGSLTNNSRNSVEKKYYKCGICSEKFSKGDELQEHIQIHRASKREKTKDDALDAYLLQQKLQQRYKCEICFKVFIHLGHFERHQNIHKQENNFERSRKHKRTRSSGSGCNETDEEKPFKCDICLKSFVKIEHLEKHRPTHEGENPYKCEYCGETFIGRRELGVHKLTHTDEKPYTCEICSKQFAVRQSLNDHVRIHRPRRFVCDVCNKSFPRKQTLTIHQRIHTGEKPYSCHICKKRFRQKGSLTGHLRFHAEGSI